jgi:hypothetical protein
MAPHSVADEPLWETPTYTPSKASIQALKRELRLSHNACINGGSWISQGSQQIDSHDRDEASDPAILQLTLDDIQELEDAVDHFNGVI